MLPELTKLKITTVQCKHLSTHLVTGDGREDALVRLGAHLQNIIIIIIIIIIIYLHSMQK